MGITSSTNFIIQPIRQYKSSKSRDGFEAPFDKTATDAVYHRVSRCALRYRGVLKTEDLDIGALYIDGGQRVVVEPTNNRAARLSGGFTNDFNKN